jgi:hypothetical protein
MGTHPRYDGEQLGELLEELGPPPRAWSVAAKELPRLRRQFDEILALAEADAAFRGALIDDLEEALRGAGYEPRRELVTRLRGRLGGGANSP